MEEQSHLGMIGSKHSGVFNKSVKALLALNYYNLLLLLLLLESPFQAICQTKIWITNIIRYY